MDENKLSYRVFKKKDMPEDHFNHYVDGYDRQLGYELLKQLKIGEFYTVRITNTEDDGEKIVSLEIGRVTPIFYKPTYPKKLTLAQRLRVLVTGDVSIIAS